MSNLDDADRITRAIHELLRGLPPEIQGAILADCLAIFLAGHQGPDAPEFRETILKMHIDVVRDLIPVNEAILRRREGLG